MSLAAGERLAGTRRRAARVRTLVVRVLFGSRVGLALFLGTLVFVSLYWRVGVYINDNYTLVNALAAMRGGSLAVETATYGGGFETPGMVVSDGRYYGRNYGQLVLALPFVLALEALAAVADPGLLFASGWSLLVVALGVVVGRVADDPRWASAGAVCGLGAFLLSAAFARPVPGDRVLVAALQLTAMVTTGLVAVTLYRLLARMYRPRVGLTAAAGAVAATPLGFWAPLPKRHVYTAAVVLGVCYCIYRSRADVPGADALVPPVGFRALAYALVGLSTWLHAGEAFVLFLALIAVDVPTAPTNDWRSLAVVGGAFGLSLVPFLVTNAAVAGDPLRPPRLLPTVTGGGASGGSGAAVVDGPGSETSAGAGLATTLLPAALAGPLGAVLDRLGVLVDPFAVGVRTIVTEPSSLYRVFVRGGYIAGIAEESGYETTYMTVLESGPLLAALTVPAVAAVRRAGHALWRSVPSAAQVCERAERWRRSPRAVTDALVVAIALLFTLVYVPQLPVQAQVTARYLLVLFPLSAYGLARQRPLRRALGGHARTVLWTYLGGVLLGAQLFVVVVAAASLGRGEVIQVHAVVALSVAVALAVAASVTAVSRAADRITAALVALAAALGTDFLLLSGVAYFQTGYYALPVVGELARLLALV